MSGDVGTWEEDVVANVFGCGEQPIPHQDKHFVVIGAKSSEVCNSVVLQFLSKVLAHCCAGVQTF
eukprot:4256402-Amphidinium_carterae.1